MPWENTYYNMKEAWTLEVILAINLKYFLMLSHYSGIFPTEPFDVFPINIFGNVSKILAQFKKVFNFKKFLYGLLLNF